MKKNLDRLYGFLFVFLISLLLLPAPGCSGGVEIPEPVCNYGTMICNTTEYLCIAFPEIPPAVCVALNGACNILEELCSLEPGSPEYEEALSRLEYQNSKLKEALVSSGAIKKE